jgi:hypothetical protein
MRNPWLSEKLFINFILIFRFEDEKIILRIKKYKVIFITNYYDEK